MRQIDAGNRLAAELSARLAQPLPGLPAQLGMAPEPRPGTRRVLEPGLEARRAAVLVLLYPNAEDIDLVLTLRTGGLSSHGGQVSFPGGSLDPGEEAVEAALREAYEELAVQPEAVQVLGQLTPLYIPASGFSIYPVVGYTARRPDFVPNEYEVAEVIEAPLSALAAHQTRGEEWWQIRDAPVRVPFYALGPHKVWGATAMVISELLEVLGGLG